MSKQLAESLLTDDTIEKVRFNGKTVGHIGRDNSGSKKLFVWSQTPLRFVSTSTKTGYSMSQKLIDRLADRNVDSVFISDAETYVPFSKIETGDVLHKTDNRFNNPPDDDQRVVYVSSF